MTEGAQVEKITPGAHKAAEKLLQEMELLHGEVTVRAVNGKPKGIRLTRNWEDGKSAIEEKATNQASK